MRAVLLSFIVGVHKSEKKIDYNGLKVDFASSKNSNVIINFFSLL